MHFRILWDMHFCISWDMHFCIRSKSDGGGDSHIFTVLLCSAIWSFGGISLSDTLHYTNKEKNHHFLIIFYSKEISTKVIYNGKYY